MKGVFVILTLVVTVSYCVDLKGCSLGPSYWCQSEATAVECGVAMFCKAMETPSKAKKIQFKPHEENVAVASPVQVGFYYESLCPGCKGVWQEQLFPTWQKLNSSGIVKFDLVPYGNARESKYGDQWVFNCQHGATECTGNLMETCVLHYYPDPNQHIPFIHCLEYYGPSKTNAVYCAGLSNITYSQIDTCVNGPLGNSLEHEMAVKTDALNPPHQYVPWLTLNGKPSSELSDNMLETICNAYTGTKPPGCLATPRKPCYKSKTA